MRDMSDIQIAEAYEKMYRSPANTEDYFGPIGGGGGNIEDVKPRILDSGARREFASGAVRDIQEGKGRCDLLPLDVVGQALDDEIIKSIHSFVGSGDERLLFCTLSLFNQKIGCDKYTLMLEVSKHFEEGCKKYGENNWQKGIDVYCYIDSAVRHYLKFLRGDKDEPHDRAFCWNIMCAIWTCRHRPELNGYAKKNAFEEAVKNATSSIKSCAEAIKRMEEN